MDACFPNIIPNGKYMHPSQTPPSPYLKVKVKVLLLYSAARPDGFSSTLQPYPWQGTHPTLV